MVTDKICSSDEVTKNAKGGWKETNTRPKQIVICNRSFMDGILNFYEYIEKYLSARSAIKMNQEGNKCFFAAINHKAASLSTLFLKAQYLV